jgi:hypothetical protein
VAACANGAAMTTRTNAAQHAANSFLMPGPFPRGR